MKWPFNLFYDNGFKAGYVQGYNAGHADGVNAEARSVAASIKKAIDNPPSVIVVEPGSPEDPFHAEPEEVAAYEAELDTRQAEVKEFGFAEWQAMKQQELEENRGPLPANTGVPAAEFGMIPAYQRLRLVKLDAD